MKIKVAMYLCFAGHLQTQRVRRERTNSQGKSVTQATHLRSNRSSCGSKTKCQLLSIRNDVIAGTNTGESIRDANE